MARVVKNAAAQQDVNNRGLSPIYLDNMKEPFHNVVVKRRRTGRKRIVFGWYGGKYSHLDWLLPQLPSAHHYCETFAGSAAVLLNRGPSPVETYNDIDGDVVNFFRVLRDRGDDLIRVIGLTPFSREEFYLNSVQGKAAISGYRCDSMDNWYKGWRRFDAEQKQCHSIKRVRQECLWMNY